MSNTYRTALLTAGTAVVAGVTALTPWLQSCPSGGAIAFVDAAVLTMDSPTLVRGATVLVRDGKIDAVNPASIPGGACRIRATGKVLMPGLTDMHVHTSEEEMPLFLVNGVTLVREMNGTPAHVALRERIARGEVAGPRMLVASPLLSGPLQYRHTLITSAGDAYKAAHSAQEAGYDFLKVYDGIPKEGYEALVEAGKTLGIPLDGHIPAEVGLERVLEAGQSLQHIDKTAFAIGGHSGDTANLAKARQLFRGRRTWLTPTLASLRALDAQRTTEYAERLERPEMAYVDSASIAWWRSLSGSRTRIGPSPFYRFQLALLPVLREAGVRFLLGTDAANPLMVAGFSVHDELATLVREGGFSTWEALRSATRSPGEFLGDSLRGRVVPGAPADLILVNANPLDDLQTLRQPQGVMANGRWYTRESLDDMLARARRR